MRLVRVPASEIRVGDVIVLKPGERAAVDGVVIDGHAAIDQKWGDRGPSTKTPQPPA